MARVLITVAGIGTIFAVSLVCLFLLWVVLPLFSGAELRPAATLAMPPSDGPVHVGVDEYQTIGWTFFSTGELRAFRLDTGAVIQHQRLFEPGRLTAWSFATGATTAAFGLADGRVQLGEISFRSSFLNDDAIPEMLRPLRPGERAEYQGGIVTRTAEGQLRLQKLVVELKDAVETGSKTKVLLVDHVTSSARTTFAALTADGKLYVNTVTEQKNFVTKKVNRRVRKGELPYAASAERGDPTFLLLSGLADSVVLAWPDGRAIRYDCRDVANSKVAEELDLVAVPDAKLTTLEWLLGRSTAIAGDSTGAVNAWFRIKRPELTTADGAKLVPGHALPGGQSPVTSVAASPRSRILGIGFADGTWSIVQATSEKQLGQRALEPGSPVTALAISPKEDGVVAVNRSSVGHWTMDPRHPEANLGTLFQRVWYEGYPQPEHVWQSSSGTDDSEPKLGLVPLIFGTAKATLYSLLFAIPLALLAAIYTSEFLKPEWKSRVKPTIELMASLPSVVLGFLAALVFAPFLEDFVPASMLLFLSVPFCVLLGALLWQLLPRQIGLRLVRLRMILIFLSVIAGVAAAWLGGPILEQGLFAGDIKLWLDGQIGRAAGGWMFLLTPISVVALAALNGSIINPWLRRYAADWPQPKLAGFELVKFLALTASALLIAGGLGFLLDAAGFDLRGSVVDTYVQRNSLVVGFVMGFAVIPIIYTIAEDALSTVPEHLRAASLGAGATPWQTAVRIIIPTAMSGLFSAIMIGLGRAVGETMIVLMAAGNTPILEWNPFNGFRTLSANIAVELPEAVRNSTHYRTLFLAALTLFAMTFAVNTVAELVRLRFRKRAYQL